MDTVHYNMRSSQRRLPGRSWYLDALSAVAFMALGVFLLRPLKAIPALAFVVVLFHLGMAYYFGRAAIRGLFRSRENP